MTHKGAPKIVYTEEQITQFVTMAADKGISFTVRELGYPTWATGQYWMENRGVKPGNSLISTMAATHNQFYTIQERLIPARMIMDNIAKQLQEGGPMTAKDTLDLTNAYKKAVETVQLLEGKATSITENVTQDDNMRKLLEEMNKKNAEIEGKQVEAPFTIVDHEYDTATNRDE